MALASTLKWSYQGQTGRLAAPWSIFNLVPSETCLLSVPNKIVSQTMTTTINKPPHADLSVIQRVIQGEKNLFAEVIKSYQGTISQQMWRFTRNRNQHEELVQDVFVEAYLCLQKYKGEAPFEHWLRVIAVRVGYKFWKERYKAKTVLSYDQVASTLRLTREEESESQTDNAELVHQLLGLLPPRDRLVLSMFYLEGESVEQTAKLIGWSETMTKVQLHRARKKMEAILRKTNQ